MARPCRPCAIDRSPLLLCLASLRLWSVEEGVGLASGMEYGGNKGGRRGMLEERGRKRSGRRRKKLTWSLVLPVKLPMAL